MAENTIVVAKGFYLGEHGWFDKRFMYEESLEPRFDAISKEINPGTQINQMIQNLDFAPTFLDYAGVPIQGNL